MDKTKPDSERDDNAYTLNELLACPREELEDFNDQRLAATSPPIVARMLERVPVDDRRTVFRKYSEDFASEILSEMNPKDSA